MPDHDPLRSALADLKASALPLIDPPGLEQVRRAARRRRNARSAVAALAIAALAIAVGTLPNDWVHPPGPAPLSQPAPVSPTVGLTSVVPAPTSPATSSATAPRTAPAAAEASSTRSCLRGNHISVTGGSAPNIRVEVDAIPLLCPDETLYFFWATYEPSGPDSLQLMASKRLTLDATRLYRTVNIGTSDPCHAWVIVEGSGQIRASLPRPSAYGYGGSAYFYGATNTRHQHLPEQPACYPEPDPDPSPSG